MSMHYGWDSLITLHSLHQFIRLLINIAISDKKQPKKMARSRKIISAVADLLALFVWILNYGFLFLRMYLALSPTLPSSFCRSWLRSSDSVNGTRKPKKD